MKNIKTYLILTITILLSNISLAQKLDPEDAKEHFKHSNFLDAYELYQKLVIKEPNNPEYNYNTGVCLVSTNDNHAKAINYLEKAVKLNAHVDAEYYLAKAYHSNLKLDKALSYFKVYKNKGKGAFIGEVDNNIRYVKNAQNLIKSPLNIVFENLGDKINSEFPDYFPLVTPKENFIVFTSRRKSKIKEFDGYYPSAIYTSKTISGNFPTARRASQAINTMYDDQAVGLSYNADKLYIYLDDLKNSGDIYESDMKNFKFKKKVKMGEAVNSKGFESAATISADENTLFFSSKRKGSLGGKDIYMTRKLPNGKWAEPQNLGPNVNTEFDEDFPNLFYDGKTLYFSSKGHDSMGGYDYFKSTWDPIKNEWSKAKNLGFPLNTPRDNISISFTEDEVHAYVSCWRKDSYGFQDIYRVTFKDKNLRETIIKAKIISSLSEKIIKKAFIVIVNDKTNEERNYTPNSINGGVIITLPEGNYTASVNAKGYEILNEKITIKGKSDFVPSMSKIFTVTPSLK
ncbi:MAG: tetratricopeptide repeat protein [Vicingaceae bacterium]